MANTVYDSKTIKLQDETEVTLVPLAIGRLRRFMKAWAKVVEAKDEDEAFDIYINCCGIALEKQIGGNFEKTADVDKVLTDDYREYLEDILDQPTIFEILDVCGGLKLNDPKLLEEAERLATEAAGTD